MAGRLAGKVALITGTGRGQGRAAALRFTEEGARVVGCDVIPENNEETIRLVRERGGEMVGMVLVGQPALRGRLKDPIHEALSQRTPVRYTLAGLSRAEATEYVRIHMEAVDGSPDLFAEDALDLAYQHAKGIPRALNNVLVYALIRAAWNDADLVDKKIVDEVIKAQTQG